MKTKTQKIYIADDGKEFTSEIDCKKYEEQMRKEEKTTSYWQIVNQPDLTERRGHYGLIIAKVQVGEYDDPEILLEDYCFRTFGRPIAFAQGCSPIFNWRILKVDIKKWNEPGKIRVGDYSYDGQKIWLVMGERESGLVVK